MPGEVVRRMPEGGARRAGPAGPDARPFVANHQNRARQEVTTCRPEARLHGPVRAAHGIELAPGAVVPIKIR